jgi:hypothetical protein
MGMRTRVALGISVCAVVISLSFATAAMAADPVATTLQATAVTSTSADLQGSVYTAHSDSVWTFQYGTSTAYSHTSGVHPVGTGLTLVAQTISGLTPGTTYHYRLVAVQEGYPSTYSLGADATFTTLKAGSGKPANGNQFSETSLGSRRLKVKHRIVGIPFKCAGAAGTTCSAKISLSTQVKSGKRSRTVACGKGKFLANPGHRHTVRANVGQACDALLTSAPHHTLKATLKARFAVHQKPLRIAVTLVGT